MYYVIAVVTNRRYKKDIGIYLFQHSVTNLGGLVDMGNLLAFKVEAEVLRVEYLHPAYDLIVRWSGTDSEMAIATHRLIFRLFCNLIPSVPRELQ